MHLVLPAILTGTCIPAWLKFSFHLWGKTGNYLATLLVFNQDWTQVLGNYTSETYRCYQICDQVLYHASIPVWVTTEMAPLGFQRSWDPLPSSLSYWTIGGSTMCFTRASFIWLLKTKLLTGSGGRSHSQWSWSMNRGSLMRLLMPNGNRTSTR